MPTLTNVNKNKFSLTEFIKTHKSTIDRITPRNPSIPKSDEWRDEFYDKFF